ANVEANTTNYLGHGEVKRNLSRVVDVLAGAKAVPSLTSVERHSGDTTAVPRVPKAAPIPPPSKIFTGREDVLTEMGEYFDPSGSSNEQRVYVLYGLGGAGKTQIGLKFIQGHAKQ